MTLKDREPCETDEEWRDRVIDAGDYLRACKKDEQALRDLADNDKIQAERHDDSAKG